LSSGGKRKKIIEKSKQLKGQMNKESLQKAKVKSKKIKEQFSSENMRKVKEKARENNVFKIAFISVVTMAILSLVGYFVFVANFDKFKPSIIFEREDTEAVIEKEVIRIHVPTADLKKLETKEVEIDKSTSINGKYSKVFEEIKKNSKFFLLLKDDDGKEKYYPFFGEEAQILNTYQNGDRLYISVNKGFKDMIKSKHQELLLLYSLVNSYTEDGEIKYVKLLIDGLEENKLVDYSLKPYYKRDTDI